MPRKTLAAAVRNLVTDAASMRPRPDAAENPARDRAMDRGPGRFNEAAARCRGKRAPQAPRVAPAAGFNEAAARCRGKHALASVDDTLSALLQ